MTPNILTTMTLIDEWSLTRLVIWLAWILIHVVWQGVLIGTALWLLLKSVGSAASSLRYGLSCTAMLAIVVTASITAVASREHLADRPAKEETVIESAVVIDHSRSTETSIAPASETPSTQIDSALIPPVFSVPERFVEARHTVQALIDRHAKLLVTAWLLGVAFYSIRLIVSFNAVRVLRRMGTPVTDPILLRTFRNLIERLNLSHRIRLVQSSAVGVPAVLGWIRPIVLFPIAFTSGLSLDQIEALLAHELAHIKRHDYFVNLIQTFVETVFFYHPVIWWISNSIRNEREHCCDAIALRLVVDKGLYANALFELAQRVAGTSRLSMSSTGGHLTDRIRRILKTPTPAPLTAGSIVALGSVFALTVALVLVSLPKADANDPASVATAAIRIGPEETKPFDDGPVAAPAGDPNHDESLKQSGIVFGVDGKPLKDVEILLFAETGNPRILIQNGRLRQGAENKQHRPVQTDEKGRFEVSQEPSVAFIAAMHPEGFVVSPFDEFARKKSLSLEPWVHVYGHRPIEGEEDERLFEGQTLTFSCHTLIGSIPIDVYGTSFASDGLFEQPHLPPGRILISRTIKAGTKTIQSPRKVLNANPGDSIEFVLEPSTEKEREVVREGPNAASQQIAQGFEAEDARTERHVKKNAAFKVPQEAESATANDLHADDKTASAAIAPKPAKLVFVIAQHVKLHENRIVSWEDIEHILEAAAEKHGMVLPSFKLTHSVFDHQKEISEQIFKIYKKLYEAKRVGVMNQGTMVPRASRRYDRIKTDADLIPDEALRVSGIVVDSDGKPVADAEVSVLPVDDMIGSALQDGWNREPIQEHLVRTDVAGKFVTYPEADEVVIAAVHPKGFCVTSLEKFPANATLKLQPWARIHGERPIDGDDANQSVHFECQPIKNVRFHIYETPFADDGTFDQRYVPPGKVNVQRSIKSGTGWVSFPISQWTLGPGESEEVILGPIPEREKR